MKKIYGIPEFAAEAVRLANALAPKGMNATVITLSGELGAGKTTWVQRMAEALGVKETVTSPTFVLEKVYPIRKSTSNGAGALEGHVFDRLIHIDAYRLNSVKELEALGWKDILSDSGNLVVLEWPERVPEAMPANAIRIRFDIVEDGRIITIDDKGKNTIE